MLGERRGDGEVRLFNERKIMHGKSKDTPNVHCHLKDERLSKMRDDRPKAAIDKHRSCVRITLSTRNDLDY